MGNFSNFTERTAKLRGEIISYIKDYMITLTPDKEVMFVDAKGNEVYPSSMDTEELTYVVDYLDYLDYSAPDQADNQ